ncbi:hypothetical protein SAMN05216215_104276 [Saccharopolyspora shandongensis]|uniref:Ku domain-containing protein n=1 Tax=Saccharopolyspora shandongensis TaxID=418495 RepID=A0A1H3PLU9_9PSEU|nr:hypothetical protein SAMN05216215_104276 [Saccharopolyspora shandongensis]
MRLSPAGLVPLTEICSAYAYAGHTVTLDDDDLEHLPLTGARRLEVQQFVPIKDIAPAAVGRAYYVHLEQLADRLSANSSALSSRRRSGKTGLFLGRVSTHGFHDLRIIRHRYRHGASSARAASVADRARGVVAEERLAGVAEERLAGAVAVGRTVRSVRRW